MTITLEVTVYFFYNVGNQEIAETFDISSWLVSRDFFFSEILHLLKETILVSFIWFSSSSTVSVIIIILCWNELLSSELGSWSPTRIRMYACVLMLHWPNGHRLQAAFWGFMHTFSIDSIQRFVNNNIFYEYHFTWRWLTKHTATFVC